MGLRLCGLVGGLCASLLWAWPGQGQTPVGPAAGEAGAQEVKPQPSEPAGETQPAKPGSEVDPIDALTHVEDEAEPLPETEPEAGLEPEGGGFLEGPSFKFNGFIQSQAGVFIAPDKEAHAADGSPTNHGGKLGQLSMFRNTLQLEADYAPAPWVSLHAIFRGVRSLKVPADKDAQPPNPKRRTLTMDPNTGVTSEVFVPLTADELREWVKDTYYTETDVRELYVDIEATDWLSFRVGKQQVSWGETGQYRLLDVVNPVDSTWHFGSLESFEDQRIPLWMLNTQIDIPPLQGNLQVIWIPMLNSPEDHETVPLTFVGAWGLPPPKEVLLGKYRRKVFMWTDNDIKNSRAGARWKGEIGNFTYSLVYFYTHVISPPIPVWTRAPFGSGDVEVYSEFPRQHVAGLALETTLPNPVTLNVKFEAAFEPDRTYPVSTQKAQKSFAAEKAQVFRGVAIDAFDGISLLDNPKKKVLSYAFTFQRPTAIRWLNPEQTTMFVFQFMHTHIFDWKKEDMIVEIPGYDTTPAREDSFKLIGAVFTSYLHGVLTPKVLAVFALGKMPGRDDVYQGGFVSASLGLTLGNHWRAQVALNEFFGPDAYDGLGLFRDRDEVNLLVRYQF